MRTHSILLVVLCFLTSLGCGSAEPETTAEAAEPASGAEASQDEAASEAPTSEEPAQPEAAAAEPDVMQQLQGKVIQLGVNRAALEDTLGASDIDCKRAQSQRDRICTLTDEICTAAQTTAEAQPQCDNARTKCDGAKADVKEVRCKG
jgi:hypothetical protein